VKPAASLAFLWHLHQPVYRLRGERVCTLPWVRLHAIRSYYDMVRVLEEFPEVRVTINLVPALIDQIRAYEAGGSDLFREAGLLPAADLDESRRAFLFDRFFSAQEERMIGALPRYADLLARRERARRERGPAEAWREFSDADYQDLQALFDLSWFGFKAREDYPELQSLARRGLAYTPEDLRHIHAIEDQILKALVPLYRAAASRGQIEIAASPYAHPILPLLIDTEAAREAMPRASLPPRFARPEDARAQIEEGLAAVEREIGARPRGAWPSEGAVSQATAEILAGCGVAWAASDEQVLQASEREGPADPYRPWEVDGAPGLALLFRDHDLSDRIGFDYARAEPEAAADAFLAAVLERARRPEAKGGVVLVALDGENPWEHYSRAGARFLRALYGAVARGKAIACEPVGRAIARCPRRGRLRRLRAGSWIRADLGTWIGGPEKNRGWSLLGRARSDADEALRDPGLPEETRRAVWTSLRAAEGSDWFWWLDGQFESLYRAEFDQVFRGHLRQAYEAFGRPAPDALGWPVPSLEPREGEEAAAEPAGWLAPRIDGFEGDFFEWRGAARLTWASLGADASMQRARRPLDALHFGFSEAGELVLRLDPAAAPEAAPAAAALKDLSLDLSFRLGGRTRLLRLELDERGELRAARLYAETLGDGEAAGTGAPSRARAAARKILELAVPCEEVGLRPGERAGLLVRLRRPEGGVALREIDLKVPAFPSRAGEGDAA
jgi:alpha-amylase/alpha-mannosidase (GH57 family)